MAETESIRKRSCVGLLAHVDAGKTTLAEALLFEAGALRKLGRVDHGDAHLDTFELERRRGITIFSKQAVLRAGDVQLTLLDTPGHVDLSAEMERTLEVLDCAVLVIGGAAGVQSHTLWRLLRKRRIPTFLFVSKMDQPGAEKERILGDLRTSLDGSILELSGAEPEELAMCSEALLEEYDRSGTVSDESVRAAIESCELFPVCFGAALRLEGVKAFLDTLCALSPASPDRGISLQRSSRSPGTPPAFGRRT